MLTIDNNVSASGRCDLDKPLEGRAGSSWEVPRTGPRAAVLFTILAGAKRHRLEPWAYVRDVLLHLELHERDGSGTTASQTGGQRTIPSTC